jgi:KaiC/GvpD/RAD55 family RecA-like ATPase
MDLNYSENIILRHVLSHPGYLENCRPNYFKNSGFQEILALAQKFWIRYREVPSAQQLEESAKLEGKGESIQSGEIRAIYGLEMDKYQEDWLTEITELFIEYKNLVNSAVDGVKYIQSTPVTSDNIKDVINKFKQIVVERNNLDFSFDQGLDFFHAESHKQPKSSTFSSGFSFIDLVLGGGFAAKSLYVFMGMPKVGKSAWLGNLAAQAVKAGHNVAVITLEMNDRKYVKRLGANLLGIPVNEYSEAAENDQKIKKRIQAMTYENLKVPGKLFVKEFPTSQASVVDLESYLRKVEEQHGFKFKIVVVDYINILKNWRNPNSENTYMKIKQIAEDLRGVAMSNEWSVLTATQTKQSDFDSTDLSINSAAESSGLVATVDGLFGIIQDPLMYANREYKLKLIANRDDGYKNAYKMFNVDYNYMRIVESSIPMHTEG